jgi:hypothetical protein
VRQRGLREHLMNRGWLTISLSIWRVD